VDLTTTYNPTVKSIYQFISIKVKRLWKLLGFEALIWIFGLIYLALINSPEATHFTICPLSNLGFKYCPGCGLGNSISYLFRGDFTLSFHSHPLGIFALVIIIFRIITIINNNRRRYA
jgi:hypothetical protein